MAVHPSIALCSRLKKIIGHALLCFVVALKRAVFLFATQGSYLFCQLTFSLFSSSSRLATI